ncbi:MAG: transposase [Nitrospiria bacterium]
MPRCARLDAPGLLHHVIVRGIERTAIFREDRDRENFLRRLAILLPDTGTTCLAWCLLSNHIHLLVRSGPQGLAALMRRLLTGHAVFFNRRHDRVGHLFQNRYQSIVCEEEPYLLELVRYIHLNPVRAGLVPSLEALRRDLWCGHGAVMGLIQRPWQATQEVLAQFGSTPSAARRRYEAFLQAGIGGGQHLGAVEGQRGEPEDGGAYRPHVLDRVDSRVMGREAFVDGLTRQFGLASSKPRKSVRALMREVCQALDLVPNDLASGSQARSLSNGRAIIAYLGRSRYRLAGTELSEALGLSRPAVSLAAQRGQRLLAQRADLRERVAEI